MVGKGRLGMVTADEIEVRYAFSGKVAVVKKKRGDTVKKGEVLAALDTKMLQMELDLQLADYERKRAEFEIFAKRNPNPGDDLTKYAKQIEQAQLNASVKEVEIAKAKMDQATLISPVNGTVVDDGGNRVGLNVSPASNAFKILDLDALRFETELDGFMEPGEVMVKINGKELAGKTGLPRPDGKKLVVDASLDSWEGLMVGMVGEVVIPDEKNNAQEIDG
ncbi:hypothetical protein A2634_02050 [Candidatus Amesbacteria bacterium RIFCSPHIGHO2_01_FULL_48_32]|uniref:CzcB-like barrel-sandwich hybrid domain-containing protein n=1 Tax=Candidatus Amesbacteria bacterium RIFCSPLOWO2_01_FULL_48_25 TaxID=1797259 RepID=A0A1F4ZDN4_9BACT|nr:MAG: hypothetical protein A2634_02050 [Candidatus Amesbacteria bacterium RIFCSPHIGHO2_01_FULL_48_32]OGD04372.1 MAG: hypothetical protein A2989_05050 [Candidatus Amesbacteria bacterium RIFCSPLOWO2_01_FULL_48_25]HJZ06208.1 biotin/lipoyl-binding protein [Patescibacteria group bacterium]